VLAAINRQLQTIHDTYKAANSSQDRHNNKSLCASWWAFGVGVVYSLLTLGILGVNFYQWKEVHDSSTQTQLALSYAKVSADAAATQAKIAFDTERRQLTAYLGPMADSFEIHCPHCEAFYANNFEGAVPSPSEDDRITFRLKNFGVTPARMIYACSNIVSMKVLKPGENANSRRDDLFRRCDADDPQHKLVTPTVWPSESRIQFSYITDITEFVDIVKQKYAGFFFGRIIYTDIFGAIHHTYICRFLATDQGKKGFSIVGVAYPVDSGHSSRPFPAFRPA
jgi:hypothetical protein